MSEEIPNSRVVIDRLSGMPYGYRDDSDAGLAGDEYGTMPWTIDLVKTRAQELDKPFNPNPEIADRVEEDLANGALVLFTKEDVDNAIRLGKIPVEWKEDMIELVVDKNDIGVIPVGAVEEWSEQQRRKAFLLRKNC